MICPNYFQSKIYSLQAVINQSCMKPYIFKSLGGGREQKRQIYWNALLQEASCETGEVCIQRRIWSSLLTVFASFLTQRLNFLKIIFKLKKLNPLNVAKNTLTHEATKKQTLCMRSSFSKETEQVRLHQLLKQFKKINLSLP